MMILPGSTARPTTVGEYASDFIPPGTLGVGKGQVTATIGTPLRSDTLPYMASEVYDPQPVSEAGSMSGPLSQLRGFGVVLLIAGAVGLFYILKKANR